MLFALIGGEVPAIRNVGQRLVSLLAATYLLAILLIWVVPHLFERGEFSPVFEAAVRYGPLAPLAMIFLVTTERVPRAHSLQRRFDLQRPAVPHGRRARARRVRDPPVQPRQLRPGAGRGAAGHRRHPARLELAVGSARRLRRHRPGHEPLLHERGHALRALDAQPRQPRRSGARPGQVRHDRGGRHGRPALGQRHRLADCDPAWHVGPPHAPCHRMQLGPACV